MKKLTNWIAVPVAIAARLGLTRGVAAIRVRPDRKSIEQMLLRAEGWKAPLQERRQNAGHVVLHNQVKPEL